MGKRWRSIALPADVAKRVREILSGSGTGYASIGEFVRDACRRRLEELARGRGG